MTPLVRSEIKVSARIARWAVAALAALAVVPSMAVAAKEVDRFVESDSNAVAVHDDSGRIYATGTGRGRVVRLSALGAFERAWGWDVVSGGSAGFEICLDPAQCKAGLEGAGRGQFASPAGIAVDQADGAVYVYDKDNNRVQKFDANGNFELMFGGAVNATTGGDLCTQSSGHSCQAGIADDRAGALHSRPASVSPGLAVDPATGDVYVADLENRRVAQYSSGGAFERAWGWNVVPPGASGNVTGSNETQTVALGLPDGAFRLSFGDEATAKLPANASADAVAAALEGLPSIGPGDVSVDGPAGGPWVVEFTGALAGDDVPLLANDRRHAVISVDATAGTFQLYFSIGTAVRVVEVPFDATAAEIEAAIEAELSGAEKELSFTVTGPQGGPWAVDGEHGFNLRLNRIDVASQGLSGGAAKATAAPKVSATTTVSGGAFEICVAVCQAGGYSVGDPPDNGRFYSEPFDFIDRSPQFLAAAPNGIVYASDGYSAGRVMRFDARAATPAAMLLPPIGAPPLASTGSGSHTVGLAVDEVNGDLYVGRAPYYSPSDNMAPLVLQQLDPETLEVLGVHAGAAGLLAANSRGLALRSSTGEIFVGYAARGVPWPAGGFGGIVVIDDDGAQAAVVSLSAPDDPEPHRVELSGAIDPAGSVSYRFEYSEDGGATWRPVGDDGKLIGKGTPLPVSVALNGLEASRTYHARLVTTKVTGHDSTLTASSDEVSFTTPAAAPEVRTLHPTVRTPTSATLAGEINPNNAETTYYFEFGQTPAYGRKEPLSPPVVSGGKPQYVFLSLSGLLEGAEYHYRLVASNANGITFGDDVAFSTRPELPRVIRGHEMVTPPFKVVRTTTFLLGLPSLSGDTVRWKMRYFPLLEESGMPFDGDQLITRRTATGWETKSLYTLPLLSQFSAGLVDGVQAASSGDLEVQAWQIGSNSKQGALLPNASSKPLHYYTRRDGTGTAGWNGWLTHVGSQEFYEGDEALFNDDGSAMVRWGGYRGLLDDPAVPGDEDPSNTYQASGASGGATVYLQTAPPDGPRVLVSECSGNAGAGTATQVPVRVGDGGDADTLGVGVCAKGMMLSRRGATVGARRDYDPLLSGPSATALAADGESVVLTSPDPEAPGVAKSQCESGSGANTNCPPQLFLWQAGSSGAGTVRWISRPAPGMPEQQIALLGPAVFEGASRDGSTVYFKTNSPLTPDDRNGDPEPGPVTAGVASNRSWDLYRYRAPADPSSETGTLLRVSGGPGGAADPNTNPLDGRGGAARFVSDDGRRAYFVTGGPIAGADDTPPAGGTEGPGAAPASGEQLRNLYLFDENRAGAERWRFIARLPFQADVHQGQTYNHCATASPVIESNEGSGGLTGTTSYRVINNGSCVRGTPSGDAIVFVTEGRLTPDDDDEAADVYLYDALADELVRVSAPHGEASAYPCGVELHHDGSLETVVTCNAELGQLSNVALALESSRGWGGLRHFNLARDPAGGLAVYFQSSSRLIPADESSQPDVYEWRQGALSLLSSGEPGEVSRFSGNSVSGRDVFFATSSRIDPREIDDADFDIYDARIGGGFPYVPPAAPCDPLPLECESEAVAPPPSVAPSSRAFVEPSRRRTGRRCPKGKVRRKARCVRRRSARRGGKRRGADGQRRSNRRVRMAR